MNNTFKVISYEYIIWLYPFEQKVNGIKSSKSIMVVTNDGKTSNIVTVPAITKGRMEMFDEIFNTIANKNDGKQTPMRQVHPIFIAQHACGCCCRGCLERVHHIPKNRKLTKEEIDYIVQVLMTWIKRELKSS